MDKEKRTDEIVSLNEEIYDNISIDELEERLELGCWVNVCVPACWSDCTRFDPTNGVTPDDGNSSPTF